MKRITRRNAIAVAFGQDIADVEEYQSTRRGSVPVYQLDSFYVVAVTDREELPADRIWCPKERVGNYNIWYSKMKMISILITRMQSGCDLVLIKTDLPGATWSYQEHLTLEFRVARGEGPTYVKANFPDVPVEVR